MSERIYNKGNHLKTGEWVIYGICQECKGSYIMQTDKKPQYCPMCGKSLGELHDIQEEK